MIEISLPFEIIAFVILAAVALISSLMIVEHKSLVYAAIFLAILGITNAALFSLLGFTFIALFHLAVYVGAAVVFILFSITMLKETPMMSLPTRVLAFIVTALVVLVAFAAVLTTGIYLGTPAPTLVAGYRELANVLVGRFWFPLLVAALALIVTLIEAITIARREMEPW